MPTEKTRFRCCDCGRKLVPGKLYSVPSWKNRDAMCCYDCLFNLGKPVEKVSTDRFLATLLKSDQ